MKLELTARIKEALADEKTATGLCESDLGPAWIEHRAAVRLAQRTGKPLAQLLQGSGVYCPEPTPIPKTTEYLALMQRLRAEAAEADYQRMVSGGGGSGDALAVSKDVKDQLTVVVNILVSIAAVTWAFWYWCASYEPGARVLVSLFGGAVTGTAEVVLFARYWRRKQQIPPKIHEPEVAETILFSSDVADVEIKTVDVTTRSETARVDEDAREGIPRRRMRRRA